MSPAYAILFGGLVPATLYALTGIFTKSSTDSGIDVASYLVVVGLTITLVGLGWLPFLDEKSISLRSGAYAFGTGASWGIAMACFSIVLAKSGFPISRLLPFHNFTPLIGVLLAFLLFAEWRDVQVTKLLMGSVLIVVGGILVARS